MTEWVKVNDSSLVEPTQDFFFQRHRTCVSVCDRTTDGAIKETLKARWFSSMSTKSSSNWCIRRDSISVIFIISSVVATLWLKLICHFLNDAHSWKALAFLRRERSRQPKALSWCQTTTTWEHLHNVEFVEVSFIICVQVVTVCDSVHGIVLTSSNFSERYRLLDTLKYLSTAEKRSVNLDVVERIVVLHHVVLSFELITEAWHNVVSALHEKIFRLGIVIEFSIHHRAIVSTTFTLMNKTV